MGTAIIPANLQVPAHLAHRMGGQSSLSQSIGGGMVFGGASVPRISIKASRFRIMEDGAETVLPDHTLTVIIVGANPGVSKTWYDKQWSPDAEPGAPDCHSMDGIRPLPDSARPQSDLCATCKHNEWGSRVTQQGSKIKACADQKRLAVVAAESPEGPIYLLQVTPAALKGLNQYHKELQVRGIPAEIVKTKISFDPAASYPKLSFAFGGFIDAATQAVIDPLFGSDSVMQVTGEAVTAAQITMEIAKPLLVQESKRPAPIDVVAEIVEDEQPSRGFGAAKSAPVEEPASNRGLGATEKPKAAKRVAKEPAPAPAVSLSDDIANLINGLDLDDE